MQHGDISNERNFVIGFRCEGTLLEYQDKSPSDRLLNIIQGKTKRAKVNQKIYSLMNYIYWNTPYTVMLVIEEENYTQEAKKVLDDFPFNQVATIIKNVSEITMMLNTGEMSFYVDEDPVSRGYVSSQYAVSSDELNTVLKRRVKRFEETI